jgi:hypothetical protein
MKENIAQRYQNLKINKERSKSQLEGKNGEHAKAPLRTARHLESSSLHLAEIGTFSTGKGRLAGLKGAQLSQERRRVVGVNGFFHQKNIQKEIDSKRYVTSFDVYYSAVNEKFNVLS